MKEYSNKEEFLNTLSHAIGIALSIVAAVLLMIKAINLASTVYIVSFGIFALSLLILYSASTLYHGTVDTVIKQRFQVFDHAAIYVLIAGTYTPFALIVLPDAWGWSMFGVEWGLALTGIVLKLFYTGKFNKISTAAYVLMGWIVVIAIKPLMNNLSTEGLKWLFIGGAFYTIGALLYMIKKIPFNHAIFHIFVLLGSFSHFVAVYFYI
ncbi:MAG: hemolysin III family protein [Bacteroidales bacterium]|nr:hemolysin III family protein [Bacteroidales bacterium]